MTISFDHDYARKLATAALTKEGEHRVLALVLKTACDRIEELEAEKLAESPP